MVEPASVIPTQIDMDFWPRYNENANTMRFTSIAQFRSYLTPTLQITKLFIPGINPTTPLQILKVIEMEAETFTFYLQTPANKVMTLPYGEIQRNSVYRNLDKVLELMRQTDNPAPWSIDPRIDDGGYQWTVNNKDWNYRAKNEDFMLQEYGFNV